MGKCNLQYEGKQLIAVLDDNGNPSQLYQEAVSSFGEDKALEIFLVSKSNEFMDIFGSQEPTLKTVLNYITNQNKTQETLTVDDTIDLIETGSLDPQVFYDEMGLFSISSQKLKTAGYNDYEINNLKSDLELQAKVKTAVERLNNTENVEFEEVDRSKLQLINEVNNFGKLIPINPEIVRKEILSVSEFSELPYTNITQEQFEKERQNYKKAEVYIEVDGEIRPQKNTETALKIPLVVKQTTNQNLLKSLQTLLSLRLDVMQENEQTTEEALKYIENELIKDGLDVIGLNQKPIDQDLVDYLRTLNSFLNVPTKENTDIFADLHDTFFDLDTRPKVEPVKKTDKNLYVKLDTTLSEEEVYEKTGLIKAEKDLWIKTAKEDLETLYNNVRTYTEKYPKGKTLEQYVQEQITDYNNAEIAEAIVLYKMYYDVLEEKISKVEDNQFVKEFYQELDTIYEKEDKGEIDFEDFEVERQQLLITSLQNYFGGKYFDLDGKSVRISDHKQGTVYHSASDFSFVVKRSTSQTGVDFTIGYNEDIVDAIKFIEEIVGVNKKVEPQKPIQNFTGNAEYLTTEYVADFNIETLKEKAKNSAKYRNFYSNFDINENGIYLKYSDDLTLKKVRLYADENLKNYSLLSKQLPNLKEEQEIAPKTKTDRRIDAVNNPQAIDKFQGQLFTISETELIARNTTDEFIKIGEDIYENTDTKGSLSQYTKLEKLGAKNYNTVEVKLNKQANINDYMYLEISPEKFTKTKKYTTTNLEEYDC